MHDGPSAPHPSRRAAHTYEEHEAVTDTYWADVSDHQGAVDDSYPHPVLAFRSNDGTYRDKVFAQNLAWAKAAADSGRISCFIVYFVYYPNWADGIAALEAQTGTPHPKMAVMIDVESWGGKVSGDQSDAITATRNGVGAWLGSNARVIAYGNQGDLNGLYPNRPADLKLVVAGYGQVVNGFPGEFAQQYTDAEQTAPFGRVDMNVARGMTPADVAAALGVAAGGDIMANSDEILATIQNVEKIVADMQNKVDDPNSGVWPVGFDTHAKVAGLVAKVDALTTAVQTVYDAVHALPITGGTSAAVVSPADKSAAVAALTTATGVLTDLTKALTVTA
jgi:hypothetical protein